MTFLIRPATIAATSALAVSYAVALERKIESCLDRRIFEKEADSKQEILENPPTKTSKKNIHNEYRRKANDALIWIEKNIPEKYSALELAYKNYLRETVEKDDGAWSNGVFTHHYARGAPDSCWGETVLQVTARALSAFSSISHAWESEYNKRIWEHNKRVPDAIHEELFRAKHHIDKTPPASPTER